MLIAQRKFTVTLIFYIALVFIFAGPSEARGFAGGNLHHRDHANLKRMFRKRAPAPQTGTSGTGIGNGGARARGANGNTKDNLSLPPAIGAGSDPASISDPVASDNILSSSDILNLPSSSFGFGLPTSILNLPTFSSGLSSSSSSTPTSSSTLSSSSSSSIPTQSSTSQSVVSTSTPAESRSTITRTASVTAGGQAAETSVPPITAAAKKKTNVVTILIAIAASIGGVVILWTIFRKWKLARSSKFDQRLQPIDWQPTNPEDSPDIHRRVQSDTSFQSGDNVAGRGVGGYGATSHGSDLGHGGADFGGHNPLPEHDFTANSNLAPVGGYADLARGPSPQPQMQQTLARGPSLTRPDYEVGVPLHHQAAYAEAYDYNGDRVRF